MQSFIPLVSTVLALTGQLEAKPAAGNNVIEGCFLVALERVDVFAKEAGMLKSVDVKKGQEVVADQVVAQIDDTDAVLAAEAVRYQYDSDVKKAKNRLTVEFADKSIGVTQAEWKAAVEANRKVSGAFSVFEVRKLELTYQRSITQKDMEEYNLAVAVLDARARFAQLKQAQEAIARRKLRAPHDGEVINVDRMKGSWVTPGQPVIQLLRMDRFEVEGRVPADRYRYDQVEGQKAKVTVTRGGQTPTTVDINTHIIFASPEIDEDNAFRITAEIENKRQSDGSWLLSPGDRATITLLGK